MKSKRTEELVKEEILNEYEHLYRLAFTYVHNEHDAMDVVQESVYKTMTKCDNVKSQYIKSWLCRIVINTAIDFPRKRKREVIGVDDYQQEKMDQYTDFDTRELLATLKPKEQEIILLRFFKDMKLCEISEVTGITENSVKSILYRSLKRLKIQIMKGDEMI